MIQVLSYTLNDPWRCRCGTIVKANEPHGKEQGCDWPSPEVPSQDLVCSTAYCQCAAKDRRIATLEAKLHAWNRAAADAGFAGSEYHDDPAAVFARVREINASRTRIVEARKAAEAECDRLRASVKWVTAAKHGAQADAEREKNRADTLHLEVDRLRAELGFLQVDYDQLTRELAEAREDTARLDCILDAEARNQRCVNLPNGDCFGFDREWWANIRGKIRTFTDGRAALDAARTAERKEGADA